MSIYIIILILIIIFLLIGLKFKNQFIYSLYNVKLRKYDSSKNKLIQKLISVAPATYEHSLVVANMTEKACDRIGANSLLGKVGAYYHDVGKVGFPMFYIENQTGNNNPHDALLPKDSVGIILTHVSQGVDLAEQNKLPKAICDMIIQHHGTTLVGHFYEKEKKLNPDALENNFRYKGEIPQFKEAGVLMLADTVEAATKSFIKEDTSFGDVKTFIEKLIQSKINDGQLNDSGLTIGDIAIVKETFLEILKARYHNRVKYEDEQSESKGS